VDGTLTLKGVRFVVPSGLVQITNSGSDDVIFLFNNKDKEGTFVVIPSAPSEGDEVASRLIATVLRVYFPKESKDYRWHQAFAIRKVSRFETGNGATEGFNGTSLVVYEYRQVVFDGKNLLIGNIFEVDRGKEAAGRFNSGSKTISMGTCDTDARIIYSITNEKYDPSNPPCQLIAVP
jgi:hypothetical protein